jgi:hypothetical protein
MGDPVTDRQGTGNPFRVRPAPTFPFALTRLSTEPSWHKASSRDGVARALSEGRWRHMLMTMNDSKPSTDISSMIGRILLKTFYGHTMGEVLALSVALERVVDEICALNLGGGSWEQDAFAEYVLGHVPRDQKLKLLKHILIHVAHEDPDAVTSAIVAAYRLRDSLAHSALVEEGLDEQGWRLEGRRRGVERSVQVSLDEVTNTVEAGKNALDELIRLCGAPTKPTE